MLGCIKVLEVIKYKNKSEDVSVGRLLSIFKNIVTISQTKKWTDKD